MNQSPDHDPARGEGDDLSPRQWAIFLLVGVPVIAVLAVVRALLVEDSSLGNAAGAALLVAALAVVGAVFFIFRARK
jgi:hypothetical protein